MAQVQAYEHLVTWVMTAPGAFRFGLEGYGDDPSSSQSPGFFHVEHGRRNYDTIVEIVLDAFRYGWVVQAGLDGPQPNSTFDDQGRAVVPVSYVLIRRTLGASGAAGTAAQHTNQPGNLWSKLEALVRRP
jgi:hypothetical protein